MVQLGLKMSQHHSASTTSMNIIDPSQLHSIETNSTPDKSHQGINRIHTSQTLDLANNNSSNLTYNSNITANWTGMPKMDNFVDILKLCCSIAVIIGSLVPYVPQYIKIKRSLNSDGFSTYVCLTLLLANILRIEFWFGHHFELPLLIQSFVVIVGMLILMELCVRVKDKSSSYVISSGGQNRRRYFINGKRSIRNRDQSIYAVSDDPTIGGSLSDSCSYQNWRPTIQDPTVVQNDRSLDQIGQTDANNASFRYESLSPSCNINSQHKYQSLLGKNNSGDSRWSLFKIKYSIGTRDFWDWDDFRSYLIFLFMFTLTTSLLTYLMIGNHIYVEGIGFVAVLTESMLGVPQLLRNYKKKSTLGMSVEMVIMWLSGDLFKTLYFILRSAPPQFIICGSIQVVVDILILYQVLWFKRSRVNYRKLPNTITR